jgi:predicted GTPase
MAALVLGETKAAALVRRLSWGSLSGKHAPDGSVDAVVGWELDLLEAPLKAKTDLIDDLSILWPLNQQVKPPGIIVVGARGAGKSSILYALTGMPFPHSSASDSTKCPIKMQISSDPTVEATYALVSTVDPACSPDEASTKRVTKLEDLPRVLAKLNGDTENRIGEEEGGQAIYVKVVRPSGTAYTVVDLPGVDEKDPESVRVAENFLREDPNSLILVVLPLVDMFERAFPVALAKRVDPESRRTIGVVTKTDLVQKEMDAVEKLQMTSQANVSLPLGYIAVRSANEKEKNKSRKHLLEKEHAFFTTNPLLAGLRPERWGSVTLKKLIVEYQCNAIGQLIPDVCRRLHAELRELEKEEEEDAAEPGGKKEGKGGKKLLDHQEFFTKLCTDTNSLVFEIGELALSSDTRQERLLNLGARLADAIKQHEEEARKALPAAVASKVGPWLNAAEEDGVVVGSNEPRVYVSRDSLSHDVFRKSVRAVCGPVLRTYATALLGEASEQLREVAHILVQEKFRGFPWLIESLKHEVNLLLEKKKGEAERVLGRIVASEMNWCYLNETDLNAVEREVALNMAGKTGGGLGFGKVAPSGEQQQQLHWSAEMSEVLSPSERDVGGKGLSRFDPTREARMRELALDAYVRLLLRRVFYAVPMNIRSVILDEFRHDLVSMVAEKYNDEAKLRTLMSEELWKAQQRQQRGERKASLTDLMKQLDLLS